MNSLKFWLGLFKAMGVLGLIVCFGEVMGIHQIGPLHWESPPSNWDRLAMCIGSLTLLCVALYFWPEEERRGHR